MTVNPARGGEILAQGDRTVRLERAVEMDEQWSFVGRKANPRGLWYAVDHATNTVLAYVFGRRKDHVLMALKALLSASDIRRYYTND